MSSSNDFLKIQFVRAKDIAFLRENFPTQHMDFIPGVYIGGFFIAYFLTHRVIIDWVRSFFGRTGVGISITSTIIFAKPTVDDVLSTFVKSYVIWFLISIIALIPIILVCLVIDILIIVPYISIKYFIKVEDYNNIYGQLKVKNELHRLETIIREEHTPRVEFLEELKTFN